MYDQKLKEKLRDEIKSRQEMIKYMFSQRVNFYNYHDESPIYIYNLLTGKITEETNKEKILTMCLMPASVRSVYLMFYTREATEEYKWLFETIDGWVEYSIQKDIGRWTNNFVPIENLHTGDTFTTRNLPFINDTINVYLEENRYKDVCTNDNDLKKVKEVKLCVN